MPHVQVSMILYLTCKYLSNCDRTRAEEILLSKCASWALLTFENSVIECFSFNVYMKSHLLDVLIQFFNYLTLLNLMRRFASLCLSSNQFWCSSYMTRCTLSYQPLHLLPFSWFLSFAMSKYWAFEESPIYLTQVQSTPVCLLGPLCDFIELDTVHRNNNLRVHL